MGQHTTTAQTWEDLRTGELIKAFELAIAPDDLLIRAVAIAVFKELSFSPEDIKEIIHNGEYFNSGWAFHNLDTGHPSIIEVV